MTARIFLINRNTRGHRPPYSRILWEFTQVVLGVFRAASSFVCRGLRIWTYQALSGFDSLFVAGHDELVRWLSGLAPLLDDLLRVEVDVLFAVVAGTVSHTRHHEKTHATFHRIRTESGFELFVIFNEAARRYTAVGPSAVKEQLSTPIDEFL